MTGKPGVLQSMESQRVRHDWETEKQQHNAVTRALQARLPGYACYLAWLHTTPFIIPRLEVPTSYPTQSSSPPGMVACCAPVKEASRSPVCLETHILTRDTGCQSATKMVHLLTWESGDASQSVHVTGKASQASHSDLPTLATLEIPAMPGSSWGSRSLRATLGSAPRPRDAWLSARTP